MDMDYLIDEANSVGARTAIKLLQQALSINRTNFLAAKAYHSLAIAHEELGHSALAIRYYSKAMDILGPFAEILY